MMRVFNTLWRVLQRIGPSQIGLLAAGVAYYALLAMFPAIAALIAIAGLVTDPDQIVRQLETLTTVIPEDAAAILVDQAVRIAGAGSQGLSLAALIGISFAIYLATMAVTALVHGLNVAHGIHDLRSSPRYWASVILLTICLGLGAIVMFLLLVVMPAVLAFLPEGFLSLATAEWLRLLRWIVVAVVVLFGIVFLYRFGPAERQTSSWVTPGAILAGLFWFGGSFAFSLYVANFANYNASFGSLGGVVVLLTWLWLSAYIVILGAMVDAERGD